jgi:dCMP deaminase
MNKWDKRFISLARHVAQWSKDPSTKVGAVIVDENKRIISLGFNGFAVGVDDNDELLNNRELKLQAILHAEENAILFAKQDLSKCTLYVWPLMTCAKCASKIIQSGIKRVISCNLNRRQEWENNFKIARQLFDQSGVVYTETKYYVLKDKVNGCGSNFRNTNRRKNKPTTQS